jgi:hypothetical protein
MRASLLTFVSAPQHCFIVHSFQAIRRMKLVISSCPMVEFTHLSLTKVGTEKQINPRRRNLGESDLDVGGSRNVWILRVGFSEPRSSNFRSNESNQR